MPKAEKKVKKLYEMLFPYNTYNGNRANTCIMLEKELRQLCREETRHVLLLVARFLGIEFTKNTSTATICGKIQKDIQMSCLNLDNDRVKSSYIIGRVTGIPPIEAETLTLEDRMFCRGMSNAIYPVKVREWSDRNRLALLATKQYLHIPSLKTYSIKDAERFWSNPETRDYVYIPGLRVVGNVDVIKSYFIARGHRNRHMFSYLEYAYTVNNYNDPKIRPNYDREFLEARDAPHVELFDDDEYNIEKVENKIRKSLLTYDNIPVGFADRIVAGVKNGTFPLTINGKPTTYNDICN